MIITIRIIPKAHKNEIVGWENDELKIRIRSVPEKGKANQELIDFLSKKLGISKSQIEIISGTTSRHKKISISGITRVLDKNS